MEMAHRLSRDTTKCKQIHGHGMQVELVFLDLEFGPNDMAVNGFGETLEFGAMKRKFRDHIDNKYDHHLVLNEDDPWAGKVLTVATAQNYQQEFLGDDDVSGYLPGLTTAPGEPTVENLAKWIAMWAAGIFHCDVVCRIEETRTNGAEVMASWNGFNSRVVR